ncbi:MAG: fumarylacetoacetate hydrolase family protein [Gordonia sp. (in: high G+C Gram-positive bacteria)]
MRLATIGIDGITRAVKLVERDGAAVFVELGHPDLRTLLATPGALAAAEKADGPSHDAATAVLCPPVNPDKIVCVTHNYGAHIKRLGISMPQRPRLSTKFASSLIGPHAPIGIPADAHKLDAAVELAVVIGTTIRHPDQAQAEAAIAGFTVMNDVTDRDVEFEAEEWGTGNIWDGSTPLGPYLVTPDELPGGVRPSLPLTTTIDGRTVQSGTTADLHFDPVHVVSYAARFMELNPGDVVATGTPSSPSHDHGTDVHLHPGQQVVAAIEGLGACRNQVVAVTTAS